MRRFGGAITVRRRSVGRTTLVLSGALLVMLAFAPQATALPTGILALYGGYDATEELYAEAPGLGVIGGIRVHDRVGLMVDGHIAPRVGDSMAWYVLGGVRLNPLLRSTGRIDLDIEAGAGRDHSWAMGRYVTDDDAPSTYTIVRFEATALGSAADHFGIGPRVRWELQPVFVHEVTYTNGVDTDRRGALALRGSTIIVALVMEADGPRETNHVSWDIGVGVAAAGDFGRSAPLLHTGFAWTWDPRPARSAPGR